MRPNGNALENNDPTPRHRYEITIRARYTVTAGMRVLWGSETYTITHAPRPTPLELYRTLYAVDESVLP
jgi:hypothetical protein